MRWVGYWLVEATTFLLLCALAFIGLLYQPTVVWIAAPLILLAAFVSVGVLAKSKPANARLVIFTAPLALVFPIASFLLSFSTTSRDLLPVSLFWLAAYYAGGVVLLGTHYLLNTRIRP